MPKNKGKVKKVQPPPRVRLFVGSAQESLKYALAVQQNLDDDTTAVKVWNQAFQLTRPILTQLIELVNTSDFGAFVFSPEDAAVIRRKRYSVARDNVIFELGLFIGRLGIDRAFILVPSGCEDLHIPSDLSGVVYGTFFPEKKNDDRQAALGSVCTNIANRISELGGIDRPSPERQMLNQIQEQTLATATLQRQTIHVLESLTGIVEAPVQRKRQRLPKKLPRSKNKSSI